MTNPSRYDQLSPLARALVDDHAAPDLAEMLVKAQDELAGLRAAARSYCPTCGRGDAAPTVEHWEQQKQRADRAEAALARVQALADEYPAGIDTALIHEALDTATPAPAPERCGNTRPHPAHKAMRGRNFFQCAGRERCTCAGVGFGDQTCKLHYPAAPAATEATDTQKSICDCPPTNAGLDLCTACPGRKKDAP